MTRSHDGILQYEGDLYLYWLRPGVDPRQFPPSVQQVGTEAVVEAGLGLAEAIAADVERQREKWGSTP